MIHCTGGAQTKVMKFVGNIEIVKDDLLPVPPLFKTIQQTTGTSSKEMFEVFNMGHRMEIYTDNKTAESIMKIANSFGIESKIIGHCNSSDFKILKISNDNETLIWNF